MDFYKLLTRSTKLSRIKPQVDLPSAGEASNPQLFGNETGNSSTPGRDDRDNRNDDNAIATSRKRKRNGTIQEEVIPREIDYFNTSSTPKAQPLKNASTSKNQSYVDDFLDTESCKRILRSHKVKISVLHQIKKVKSNGGIAKAAAAYIQPVTLLSQLGSRYNIRRALLENINSEGYTTPTEVQLAALPILLGEKLILGDEEVVGDREAASDNINLLAVAPTGSGKTLAFLIPLLNSLLLKRTSNQRKDGPYGLVVAPTRELAAQIVNEGRKLARNTGLKITLVKKGMRVGSDADISSNDLDLANDGDSDAWENSEHSDSDSASKGGHTSTLSTIVKSDIVVATPLALFNALLRERGKRSLLPSVEFLVLDEADRLLDPLFLEQTMSVWKSCTNPKLSTSLWSATMSSTIEQLAVSKISAQSDRTPIIVRLIIGLKDTALPTVSHKLIYAATEQGKLLALRQLLRPTGPTTTQTPSSTETELRLPFLVFTQTIPRAVALHSELRYDIPPEAGGSSRVAVLHAGMSESTRSRVMSAFRRGEVWVIVTTDLLARGVDFRGLNGVVNYDVPTSAAAYVHRAGRTGRAGRKGGVVVTLYTEEDVPILRPIANVIDSSEKMMGKKESSVKWLLNSLPVPSKRDKKNLKKRGVEARRPGVKGALISTKPPDERRKAMYKKSRKQGQSHKTQIDEAESEFEGFDD